VAFLGLFLHRQHSHVPSTTEGIGRGSLAFLVFFPRCFLFLIPIFVFPLKKYCDRGDVFLSLSVYAKGYILPPPFALIVLCIIRLKDAARGGGVRRRNLFVDIRCGLGARWWEMVKLFMMIECAEMAMGYEYAQGSFSFLE